MEGNNMTKFNTLIKFKDGSHMFERDHKAAFKNAKLNGLNNPKDWMYMYSQDNKDFFKNIAMRNYVSFEFKNYISFEYQTKEVI
jgi:hypothetical protein